jgi:hypothetical protein
VTGIAAGGPKRDARPARSCQEFTYAKTGSREGVR